MNQNHSKGMQLEKKYQEYFGKAKEPADSKATMSQLIIRRAIESEIPIHKDSELITKLAKLELERESPEVYYPAVAEIITYLSKLENKYTKANA